MNYNIYNSYYIMLCQEKMDNNHDESKCGTRRSRKDEQGRDYICGCGKRYLSYPALYTHIKTKHQGHQPEGTQKTGVSSITRRNKQKIDEKVLKEIYAYMDQNTLKILKELGEISGGSVQISHRIKRQNSSKQIYEAFLQLNKLTNLSLSKESTLETVLVVYLLNVGKYVCEELYSHYLTFAKLLRTCFHENGQQVFQKCFKGNGEQKIQTFSKTQCKYVPIISDFFIRLYVPLEVNDVNCQSLMQLLTYDFCIWLYEKKFTNIQVLLNKQYKILSKDIIKPKIQQKKSSKIDQKFDREESNEGESQYSSEPISLNQNRKVNEGLSQKSSQEVEVRAEKKFQSQIDSDNKIEN